MLGILIVNVLQNAPKKKPRASIGPGTAKKAMDFGVGRMMKNDKSVSVPPSLTSFKLSVEALQKRLESN